MQEIYIWIIIMSVVLFVPLFFANWITKGMLLKLMKVFASRGQKVLVEVIHPMQNYYIVGEVLEGRLVVKDNTVKNQKGAAVKRIDISSGDVYRSFGVNCLRYDEIGNRIVRPDFTSIEGFDAIKQENLFIRALYDPKTSKQEQYQLFILIGIVIAVLGIVFIAYNQSIIMDKIMLISKNVIIGTINATIV